MMFTFMFSVYIQQARPYEWAEPWMEMEICGWNDGILVGLLCGEEMVESKQRGFDLKKIFIFTMKMRRILIIYYE